MKRTAGEERKTCMSLRSLILTHIPFNNLSITTPVLVQEEIYNQYKSMFQVHNSNLSLRVPLSHLKIRMITTMMRSLNFPTILQTTKSEISSTTSTQEKASLLLLTTNHSMVSNSSSSQFCIKAPLDLNTLSNISHQLPSVDNPHQFLPPLETLQAMVSV